MRRKILHCLVIAVVLIVAMFGAAKRKSYTNISQEEDGLDDIYIAMLPEDLAISACERLITELPNSPIILKVKVVEDVEHLFGATRQKVQVVEIYSGDLSRAGKEIYLYSQKWRMSLTVEPRSIERGFINILEVGKSYLVFLSKEIEDLYSDIPVYQLYDETVIAPVFCYENISNKFVETEGMHTYIRYSVVKENEFFGETEKACEAWESLKSNMLDKYK